MVICDSLRSYAGFKCLIYSFAVRKVTRSRVKINLR